jgi:hypothetical protein
MVDSSYERARKERERERKQEEKEREKERNEQKKEREKEIKEQEKEREKERKELEKEREKERRERERERERDERELATERAKERARLESIRSRLKIACEENELDPDFCVEEMAKIMMLDENASIPDILQERDWRKFGEEAKVIFLENERIRKEKELENERIRKEKEEWDNFTKTFDNEMAGAKTEEDAKLIFNNSKYQAIIEKDRRQQLDAALLRIIEAKLSTKIKRFSIKLVSKILAIVSVLLFIFSLSIVSDIVSTWVNIFEIDNNKFASFQVGAGTVVFLLFSVYLLRKTAKKYESIILTIVWVPIFIISLVGGADTFQKGSELLENVNSLPFDLVWKAVSSDAYKFIFVICFAFLARYMAKRMPRK